MGDTVIWWAEHIVSISSLEKLMSIHPVRTEKGSCDVKQPAKGLEKENKIS